MYPLIHSDSFETKLLEQNNLFQLTYVVCSFVVLTRARCVIINIVFSPSPPPPPQPCDTDYAQWEVDKSAILGTHDRLRVEVASSIFPFFFVVFSDTVTKCSVFISFRSIYAHNRTSTTFCKICPHRVRTCPVHRFYEFRCSHSSSNLYLLIQAFKTDYFN